MSEWKKLHLESRYYEWTMSISKEEIRGFQDLYLSYREIEPKPKVPSHEELSQQYIKRQSMFDVHTVITKIIAYVELLGDDMIDEVRKAFIAGRESADIPPEAE